ncbi:fructosamine kinase family protein [Flammeovirga aprica]|uniref:Fructosamine kinase family protein n=1 Tax=Flammeovirga aprica JL-4 TaxID=694437 RepID=A0A7X9XDA3_9BACT|nr:fructosamine kinase family protein [Flammeovirga aprica]NME72595.1 fructosamine kinase family protein [Flammeovirga aprica JL-4]
MQTDPHAFYQSILQKELGGSVQLQEFSSISGGCINDVFKMDTNQGMYFLKVNQQMPIHFFEAEKEGLELLDQISRFTIPNVIGLGTFQTTQYLLLEYIDSRRTSVNYWEELGVRLAELHKNSNDSFGGVNDNYIGKLPQSNQNKSNWLDFFIEERLLPQVNLGVKSGVIPQKYIESTNALRSLLKDYFPEEKPALLHGDLWSGNTMYDSQGQPCIVDPAVYYGHREAELAFTTLFGGFDKLFFEVYNEVFPWEKGIEERLEVYNIYPLLVHTNLFGGGYLEQVNAIYKRIDKALGY